MRPHRSRRALFVGEDGFEERHHVGAVPFPRAADLFVCDADLDRKFLSNCEAIVGKDKCQRLLEAVWGFDRLDNLALFYRW